MNRDLINVYSTVWPQYPVIDSGFHHVYGTVWPQYPVIDSGFHHVYGTVWPQYPVIDSGFNQCVRHPTRVISLKE
jgi:hypothetical protein